MTPLDYALRAMKHEHNDVNAAIDRLLNEKEYSSPNSFKVIDEACILLSNIYQDIQDIDNTTDWDKLMNGYCEYELYDNE